jgi:hypothetical protein
MFFGDVFDSFADIKDEAGALLDVKPIDFKSEIL